MIGSFTLPLAYLADVGVEIFHSVLAFTFDQYNKKLSSIQIDHFCAKPMEIGCV